MWHARRGSHDRLRSFMLEGEDAEGFVLNEADDDAHEADAEDDEFESNLSA